MPSLFDAALAGAALLSAAYEAWLFKRRPDHREHLWAAVVSAASAAYAALMVVHYASGPARALILARCEGVALVSLLFACLAWAFEVSGRSSPRGGALLGAGWLAFSALVLSPWLVTGVEPIRQPFSDAIYWRRAQTPALGALQLIGLGLIVASLAVARNAPPERRDRLRSFQVGVGLWGLVAAVWTASTLAGHAPPMSWIEYGFAPLAWSLVSGDVRRYMQALARSERAVEVARSEQRTFEAMHEEVFASISEGVVVLDRLGRVLLWNPGARRLTAIDAEAAVGNRLWDVLSLETEARRALEAGLRRASQEQAVTVGPLPLRSGDRSLHVVWTLSSFGRERDARGAIAVLRDVTSELSAERALKRSEKNSRALIESLPDAVAVVAGERILYLNPALCELLGLGPEDSLSGLSAGRLVHHQDRARLREVREGAPPAELRLSTRTRAVTAEVRCLPIEFDGAPAQALFARDVTEKNELVARMIELDRMVAVGTLAAGVGHEINNPLAWVSANLEELRARASDAEAKPLVEEALQGTRRIRDIVQAIAGFSRQSLDRRPTSLREAIRSAVTMAGNEIRLRARLVVEPGEDVFVVANDAELAQVFLNLLINASQATREGSPDPHEIRVHVGVEADRAVCEVTDSGRGIEPSVMPRLFDAFFTTKPVGEGTGLGLSICQQTVRALGGEIEVESELGVGSTFRVLLPMTEPTTEPLRLSLRAPAASTRRPRLMLVDDEETLLRALSRPLNRHFDLILCASADEALESLAGGAMPDAVVTDLMMPGVSGIELYELVRERHPELAERMLFTTGGAFTAEARAFCERMEGRILPKPVAVAELRERVSEVAASRRSGDGRRSAS